MYKSTHEEHLSQPLKTNHKQFKVAVTCLTVYNGIFKDTKSNLRFYLKRTNTGGDVFFQNTITPGAYEMESLNNDFRRIIICEERFTESDYPFQTKRKFSTLGSIIEISPQGPIISFVFDDSIRNFLGFHETIFYNEYNLSPNPVDILLFDNFFLDCDIAKRVIYKQKRGGKLQIWTMALNPGFK